MQSLDEELSELLQESLQVPGKAAPQRLKYLIPPTPANSPGHPRSKPQADEDWSRRLASNSSPPAHPTLAGPPPARVMPENVRGHTRESDDLCSTGSSQEYKTAKSVSFSVQEEGTACQSSVHSLLARHRGQLPSPTLHLPGVRMYDQAVKAMQRRNLRSAHCFPSAGPEGQE